jgi:hypothetical protein
MSVTNFAIDPSLGISTVPKQPPGRHGKTFLIVA